MLFHCHACLQPPKLSSLPEYIQLQDAQFATCYLFNTYCAYIEAGTTAIGSLRLF